MFPAKTKTVRGTARAIRRAAGNFKPVNKLASVAQHPNGKFGRTTTYAAELDAIVNPK